jgi:UDP-GlcNAc:undecaprenyl-phosphate GlcNAc-1-phosphate transferase
MDINDLPSARKVHKIPIPRIGGYAIFLSFVIVMTTLTDIMPPNYVYIFYGMGIIILIGLFDDIFDMPAIYKLVGQAISAGVVVHFGNIFPVQMAFPFGLILQFPEYVGKIISVVWIVAIINAVNLLDGLDGLAAGFGLISITTITIMSFLQNNTLLPLMGLIFMFCLIVFLRFNFNPAKVFLGDAGSMLIGYFIGVITLIGYKSAAFASILIPIIILFIPFLDAISAIIRRKRNGRGIHLADKRHIHHMILRSSKTHRGAVLKMYGLFSSVAIGTLLYYYNKPIGIFIIMIGIVSTILTFWKLGVISENQGEQNE